MSKIRTFLFAAGALALAGAAHAGALTVINPSFETLGGPLSQSCGGTCAFADVAIPGWTNTGDSGQWQPGSNVASYFNSLPDGPTVAFSNDNTISQTVSALAKAGATYTLMVDLGYRKDYPDPGLIELMVGGASALGAGTPLQLSGDWATFTASYTATAADAGQAIRIVLNPTGVQGDFDNVRLSETLAGIPEPATWAMMLTGFAGMGAVLRRRRAAAAAA